MLFRSLRMPPEAKTWPGILAAVMSVLAYPAPSCTYLLGPRLDSSFEGVVFWGCWGIALALSVGCLLARKYRSIYALFGLLMSLVPFLLGVYNLLLDWIKGHIGLKF
jgi:hypothetical protein